MMELEKNEKEMFVMGMLMAGEYSQAVAKRGKRKRAAYQFTFQGEEICVGMFRYVNDVGQSVFKSLKKHLSDHGPVPRVHGNAGRRPHHALTFDEVKFSADFIKAFANEFGMPFPSPLHGRANKPPTYLPASQNYKSVHKKYMTACAESGVRACGKSAFNLIWKSCFPHVTFMTARTDVCSKCEQHRERVSAAVQETEKTECLAAFMEHVHEAQRERDAYNSATVAAHQELVEMQPEYTPPYQPRSQPLKFPHYTFDYAQMVSLPHMARQPGPLYFKTPRKVQLFGVCSEGVPRQTNYLLDKEQTIGPNGTKSHGANSVVSLLHHYFATYGHGEVECVLHADNCAGQNKNRTVVSYLAWRVIVGLHRRITLSFMVAGHTRCLVDGCFGLVKQRYRKSDTFTLPHLADVINTSATCNVAHTTGVSWYAWDQFLDQHFNKIKGIAKFHHFFFDAAAPGIVHGQEFTTSQATAVKILKSEPTDLQSNSLPEEIPCAGITLERRKYLFKEIRPFVAAPFQDTLCPRPDVDTASEDDHAFE